MPEKGKHSEKKDTIIHYFVYPNNVDVRTRFIRMRDYYDTNAVAAEPDDPNDAVCYDADIFSAKPDDPNNTICYHTSIDNNSGS